MRFSIHRCALLVTTFTLSCQSPSADLGHELISSYRLYAGDHCDRLERVVERIDSAHAEDVEARSVFKLLQAFCRERNGDDESAERLYEEVVRAIPRTQQGYEAALRLEQRKRFADLGTTPSALREQLDSVKPESETPLPLHRVSPRYPSILLASNIEGWTQVAVRLSRDGRVVDPLFVASDPPFVFDAAALQAIQHWVYEPSVTGTNAERFQVRINFVLKQSP